VQQTGDPVALKRSCDPWVGGVRRRTSLSPSRPASSRPSPIRSVTGLVELSVACDFGRPNSDLQADGPATLGKATRCGSKSETATTSPHRRMFARPAASPGPLERAAYDQRGGACGRPFARRLHGDLRAVRAAPSGRVPHLWPRRAHGLGLQRRWAGEGGIQWGFFLRSGDGDDANGGDNNSLDEE
jgi:hypothetical protein